MTTTYFSTHQTADEIRKQYRELAMLHHPDHGGNTATMQAINAEYAFCMARAIRQEKPGLDEAEYASMDAVSEAIRAAIEAIITLPGLSIEICGLWVWVGGQTRAVKDQLKSAGYRWASKKEKWYYAGVPANGRGRYNMDQIRWRYGSRNVSSRVPYGLEASAD